VCVCVCLSREWTAAAVALSVRYVSAEVVGVDSHFIVIIMPIFAAVTAHDVG